HILRLHAWRVGGIGGDPDCGYRLYHRCRVSVRPQPRPRDFVRIIAPGGKSHRSNSRRVRLAPSLRLCTLTRWGAGRAACALARTVTIGIVSTRGDLKKKAPEEVDYP